MTRVENRAAIRCVHWLVQAELSEDGGHSDDESDDGDAAEQEKLLVGSYTYQ